MLADDHDEVGGGPDRGIEHFRYFPLYLIHRFPDTVYASLHSGALVAKIKQLIGIKVS